MQVSHSAHLPIPFEMANFYFYQNFYYCYFLLSLHLAETLTNPYPLYDPKNDVQPFKANHMGNIRLSIGIFHYVFELLQCKKKDRSSCALQWFFFLFSRFQYISVHQMWCWRITYWRKLVFCSGKLSSNTYGYVKKIVNLKHILKFFI